MARPSAVVDTTFLIYSSRLKKIDLLQKARMFFDHILIPVEVRREFEPDRNRDDNLSRVKIISQIGISEGFFRACNTIDPILIDALKSIPKVDDGEAEAIAQSQSRLIPFVLIDDKKALKELPRMFSHINFFSTLTVLSLIDIAGYMNNYTECVRELYKLRKFKSSELRDAYRIASNHIGIPISPKELSKKSSLKKILRTPS